jgi:hypothetical protein
MFTETIERINSIDYKLSIWKTDDGWARFTFEKIEEGNGKRLSSRKSKIDVPDATRLCKIEILEETLAEARRDIERKQGRKPIDFEKQ